MEIITSTIATLTSNLYLGALYHLIFYFIIIGVAAIILEKIILLLVLRTETDLDDEILKISRIPLLITAALISLKISIVKLNLTENLISKLNMGIDTAIVLVIAVLIYTIFNLSFTRIFSKIAKRTRTRPNEAMLQLIKGFLKVVLIFASLLYLLNAWGIEITPLLTGLGIGGLAIAFALQSTLGNIFGGVSIILDKSVNVGDLVNLEGDVAGKIIHIGLRSTRIKTFDNEMIIIPNSKLADSNIKNVAQPEPKIRVVVPFTVKYGTNIEKVKKLVIKELKQIKGYLHDPAASVKFLEMGDSALKLKAYFYVETFDIKLTAIDEANTRIYNALNKAKIEIPFPQMDVHMKK